jgi:hypothetical protein
MNQQDHANLIEVHRLPTDRSRPKLATSKALVFDTAPDHLQKSFDALLLADRDLAKWVREMQKLKLEAVVFGGWARDRLIEIIRNQDSSSRDIDFVVNGKVSVMTILPKAAIVNPFGGFGVQATSIHVDMWNLKETFLIRRNRLPVTFEQLPLTADYTVNAIVFKPAQFFQTPQIIDSGAMTAILAKELEFAADDVAQPRVQAARAIILAVRLNFQLSSTVRSFVREIVGNPEARDTVVKGIHSYCPAPHLPNALQLLSNIEDQGR